MNLFCSGKIPQMLKVLHGTTDANKEPIFYKNAWHYCKKHPFGTFIFTNVG